MKKIILSAMLLAILCGCTPLVESSQKASSSIRGGIYSTAGKVQEMTRYNPGPTEPQPPTEGYCYRSMTDIICYDQPQNGIPNKLFGYQQGAISPNAVIQSAPIQSVDTMPMPEPVAAAPSSREMPFYVKEAPYVKSDGETVTSSKVMQDSGGSPGATPPPITGNPKRLMPRY